MAATARRLVRGGERLSPIGQGTTKTGPRAGASPERDRERVDVLRLGIDLGLDFIDTAELYGGGHAEELVGRAIAGRRERVFLASKFNPGHSRRRDLIAAAEGSLRRLGTDYLDLYQMHWPEPGVPLDETMGALATLVAEGKVRHVGLGNCTLEEVESARALSAVDPISIQMEYNLLQRAPERDLLPYCEREGLLFLAYSVLDRGVALPSSARRRVLESIAERHAATVAQIALAWVVSRPGTIALVKAASPAHLRENAAAAEIALADDDLAAIDAAFRQRVVHVAPERIRVRSSHLPGAYESVDEARRNARDLVPAPASVAESIARGRVLKPLPLFRRVDATDDRLYDLADGEVLYWAWVIAKGAEAPMPAFLKGEDAAASEGAN